MSALAYAWLALAALPCGTRGQQQSGAQAHSSRHLLEVTTPGAALTAFVSLSASGHGVADYRPMVVRGDVTDLALLLTNALEPQLSVPLDGIVATLDGASRVESALAFGGATVTQLALSPLDAEHPGPAELTVEIAPRSIRIEDDGATRRALAPVGAHDRHEPTSFRIRMPGMGDALDHVLDVDGVRMTRAYASAAGGEPSIVGRAADGWACRHVVLTVPAAAAPAFARWYQQSVAADRDDPKRQKTLDLQLWSGRTDVVTLRASGVAIVRIGTAPTALAERVQVELAPTEWRVLSTTSSPVTR